jgi:diamine N-acetyltransferase
VGEGMTDGVATMRQDEIRIRRADARDAALIAELGARTFAETFAADNSPEDMAAYLSESFAPEKQAAELADPFNVFFVAESGGAACGYAQIRASDDVPSCVEGESPVELVRIYAAREWLGRGVGAALMRACLEEARRLGRKIVWLGVWERNFRAQQFYLARGFRVVGSHVFQVGSDPQNDLIMARAL